MPKNFFDHRALVSLDETDYFHLAAALGTFQRINFVDSLDQHGPRG